MQSVAGALSNPEVAKKIWSLEANKHCADCDAQNPEWASINLCVVICKKCAGEGGSPYCSDTLFLRLGGGHPSYIANSILRGTPQPGAQHQQGPEPQDGQQDLDGGTNTGKAGMHCEGMYGGTCYVKCLHHNRLDL